MNKDLGHIYLMFSCNVQDGPNETVIWNSAECNELFRGEVHIFSCFRWPVRVQVLWLSESAPSRPSDKPERFMCCYVTQQPFPCCTVRIVLKLCQTRLLV